ADVGVAVTVLPATDLFLMGRDRHVHVPRGVAPAHRLLGDGVTCSLATNNVLNPFTPFGDCSLIRMAHLYANVAQIGRARPQSVFRHDHDAAGATDERRALRRGGRSPRRPGRSRQPRSGPGRGRGRAAFVRSQARPPQLHARRRHHPSTVTSAVKPCTNDKRSAHTMCSRRSYTTDTYLQPTEIYGLKPSDPRWHAT